MTGDSRTPLVNKIGIRESHRVYLHDPSSTLRECLGPLPAGVTLVGPRAGNLDVAVVLVTSSRDLRRRFDRIASRIKKDGMLWIGWPKKTSGVQTDLDFNLVQAHGLASGLVDVKVCAIDQTWSGLKFVYRKTHRVDPP